jgi:hypothetical protein
MVTAERTSCNAELLSRYRRPPRYRRRAVDLMDNADALPTIPQRINQNQ